MADVTISVRDDGPLMVKGGAAVVDGEGKSLTSDDTVFLCRCGESGKKPFCDGTHKNVGFKSAPRA